MVIEQQEHLPTLAEIEQLENKLQKRLPNEFKDFLLKFNGGSTSLCKPKLEGKDKLGTYNPKYFLEIDTMLSVGDILLQLEYPMNYDHLRPPNDDVDYFGLNHKNLIAFALASDMGGTYYMNLDDRDFGRIFLAWDSLIHIETKSFRTFFDSLTNSDGTANSPFRKKVFDERIYATYGKPELGLKRFKEVFSYKNDIDAKWMNMSLIEHYKNIDYYYDSGLIVEFLEQYLEERN